jgi:hypothetical protein
MESKTVRVSPIGLSNTRRESDMLFLKVALLGVNYEISAALGQKSAVQALWKDF